MDVNNDDMWILGGKHIEVGEVSIYVVGCRPTLNEEPINHGSLIEEVFLEVDQDGEGFW